jgi:hypothetical protein
MFKRIWYFIAKLEYPADRVVQSVIGATIFAVGFIVYLKGGKKLFDNITIGILFALAIVFLLGIYKIIRFFIEIKNENNNR